MPTFEVTVDDQRRAFLLVAPPNFTALDWGSVPLLIGLHDRDQAPKAFYDDVDVVGLLAGHYTRELGDPVPQALVALFPQALSLFAPISGRWNTGWSEADEHYADLDDTAAVVACVEEADRLLLEAWLRFHPDDPVPTGPFFSHVVVFGLGEGGAMGYRLAAELPSRDTRWGTGALAVATLAVCGCSAGGLRYARDTPWPLDVHAPGLLVREIQWVPDPSVRPCNLLHMQGHADAWWSVRGGVAEKVREEIDRFLGLTQSPGSGDFYRWDIIPGIAKPGPLGATFDPTTGPRPSIGPWVEALPGGPATAAVTWVSPIVAVIPWPPPWAPLPDQRWWWTWESAGLGVPNPFQPPYAVRFLLWRSDPDERDGHVWPQGPQDGFSGTEEAWQFFLDHP